MAKPKPKYSGPFPLAVRRSITWRIPIDLLERVDKLRKRDGRDRTAVVVDALVAYLGGIELFGEFPQLKRGAK